VLLRPAFTGIRPSGSLPCHVGDDAAVHVLLREVTGVVSLHAAADAVQLPLEEALGGRVHHLVLNGGGVGRPQDEDNLVHLAALGRSKGVVVSGVSTLGLRERLQEAVVSTRSQCLDDHLVALNLPDEPRELQGSGAGGAKVIT